MAFATPLYRTTDYSLIAETSTLLSLKMERPGIAVLAGFDQTIGQTLAVRGVNATTAPTVAGTNSGQLAANTTHSIALPASIASGDRLIAIVSMDGNPTFTWPAGWTSLSAETNASQVRQEIRYRDADGSEGASISIDTSASEEGSFVTYRLTNHHANAPEAGTAVIPGVTRTEFQFPLLVPTWTGATLFLYAGSSDANDAVTQAPYDYTPLSVAGTVGGAGTGTGYRALTIPSTYEGLIALYHFTKNDDDAFTWPASPVWGELFNRAGNDGNADRSTAQWRVLDNTDGDSITVTHDAELRSWQFLLIDSHGGEVEASVAVGSSATPDPPTLSPSWGADDTLWIATCGFDGGSAQSVDTAPTDFTDLLTREVPGVAGAGSGIAFRELNALSLDPGTFAIEAAETWVSGLIGVSPAAGGGGVNVTGTAAIILAAVTSAAAGAAGAVGTSAIALPTLAVVGAGAESFIGAADITLSAVTASAAGAAGVSGTAAIILAAVTAAADGEESFIGSAAIVLPSLTFSGAGAESFVGTAEIVLSPAMAAAIGVAGASGTASITLPSVTVVGAGVHAINVTGTAEIVLSGLQVAADGTVTGDAEVTIQYPSRGVGVALGVSVRMGTR